MIELCTGACVAWRAPAQQSRMHRSSCGAAPLCTTYLPQASQQRQSWCHPRIRQNFASTAVHVKLVSGGLHARRSVRRKSAEHRSACRCFHDGFPNVFVRNAVSIRNRHVAFLCSFHRPDVIFEQLSVMYALPRLFIGSFTVVLPFFPTGTLERVRSLQTDVRMCCDIRAQSTPATGHQWERRAPYCHAPTLLHASGAERSMMSSYAHWQQTLCSSIANDKAQCR